jgi:TIR domain/Trypsin-like peptidase domain
MSFDISILRPACATVVSGAERGTGYLIDERHVMTCEHVVRGGGAVTVQLGERKFTVKAPATVIDADADCAVLELTEPATGVTPLQIVSAPTGLEWIAYGFPGLAGEIGLPLNGTIQDPQGMDVMRRPALVLYSDQAAAGQGPPLGGFSGSPVMVAGLVVGHLKRVLSSKDRPGRPELGYLFATPGSEILRVLGWPVQRVDAVAKVEPPSAPQIGDDQYHVFISYSSRWRDWARALVENLESHKLRVFIDQKDLHPGDQLANALQVGLARSRGSIVLLTRAWLESAWCQEEATVLLQRSVEEKNFRLIPLLLEDLDLPPMWASLLFLDFRKHAHPEGPELDKLLYTLLGGSAPQEGSSEAKVRKDFQQSIAELIARIDAESITGQRVYQYWQQLRKTSMPDLRVTLHAANRLISMGSPRQALELLETAGTGLRARQLHALALAKMGSIDDSIAELKALEGEGHTDAETGGLLGGRYRQKAEQTGNAVWFAAARQTFLRYFEQTGDPYCGVNAANMALQANDRQQAILISGKLIEVLTKSGEGMLSHWDCATLGDAHFIIGDTPQGKQWYEKAAVKAVTFDQDRAVMRKYARITLHRLGLAENLVDDILQIPQPVAFFGLTIDVPDRAVPRFPVDLVPTVRAEIRQKLNRSQINCGVSSACAGADLLFLLELLHRGGQATVVLPSDKAEFEKTFLFGSWVSKFQEVIGNPNTKIRLTLPQSGEDVWDACRREIFAATRELANLLDQPRLLLVVWDGNSKTYVKSAIDLWMAEGDPVEKIILQPT